MNTNKEGRIRSVNGAYVNLTSRCRTMNTSAMARTATNGMKNRLNAATWPDATYPITHNATNTPMIRHRAAFAASASSTQKATCATHEATRGVPITSECQ